MTVDTEPRGTKRVTVADVPVTPSPQPVVVPPVAIQQPEATGLQRAINANAKQQAKVSPVTRSDSVTGLQRAINANIVLQRSKE